MADVIAIGFSGSRLGMTPHQAATVARLICELAAEHPGWHGVHLAKPSRIRFARWTAHHGVCIGADAHFHRLARAAGAYIVGHPGCDRYGTQPTTAELHCDDWWRTARYLVRDKEIVDASNVMITTPPETRPRTRGGTEATTRMALTALFQRRLQAVHIVQPDGELAEHEVWR